MSAARQPTTPDRAARLAALQDERGRLSRLIGEGKQRGEDVSEQIARSRELSQQIKQLEAEETTPEPPAAEPLTEPAALQGAVLSDPAQWADLREEWDELLAQSDSPCIFLTWEWVTTCWRFYGPPHTPLLVTVRTPEGELVGLAPCFVTQTPARHLPRGALAFIGSGTEADGDYLDLILHPRFRAQALETILDVLLAQRPLWSQIVWQHVAAETPALPLLLSALGERGLLLAAVPERRTVCGVLPDSFAAFLENLPSRHRRRFAGQIARRLERDFGSIEYRTDAGSEAFVERFHAMGRLHSQRFESKGEHGSFANEQCYQFVLETSRLFAERGWVRLRELHLDGRLVASRLGFLYAGTCYDFNGGFDPEYATHEVSHALLSRCVEDSIAERVRVYDLLAGEHFYKTQYFAGRRSLLTLNLWPQEAGATAKVGARLALRELRRSVRRWRSRA